MQLTELAQHQAQKPPLIGCPMLYEYIHYTHIYPSHPTFPQPDDAPS